MNNRIEEIKAQIEKMRAEKEAKSNQVTMPNISVIEEIVARKIPVTEAQIKTYFNLCQQKGEAIIPTYRNWDGKNGGEMDKEIKRLLKLPSLKRPTESQVAIVKEICDRNGWEMPETAHLTGGREGTMSKLITELIQLERDSQRLAPPTEAQIDSILEMYYCPDVDMADLHESFGVQWVRKDGKTWWTQIEQLKIKELIPELITHEIASDFLRKYQTVYYSWKRSRLSEAQIRRIRALQEKCGMKPMEDFQLMQFNKDDANKYILNTELVYRDKELVKFPKEAVYDDSEYRKIQSVDKLNDKTIKDKESIIHSLYAMMGMSGRDEADVIDSTNAEDLIRDLAQFTTEVCGVQSVYDLLFLYYTEEEVCNILNIETEEVAVSDEEDECSKAEKEILDMTELFLASNVEQEKKYISETCKTLMEKYYNEALISDETYDFAKSILS